MLFHLHTLWGGEFPPTSFPFGQRGRRSRVGLAVDATQHFWQPEKRPFVWISPEMGGPPRPRHGRIGGLLLGALLAVVVAAVLAAAGAAASPSTSAAGHVVEKRNSDLGYRYAATW